ncbi:MAG TPA: hypothetical protein VFS48_07675 [Solirubrobacterales bacterium]|nr:hypothetical protein [Solirubrobacterales bacterium]
MSGAIAFGLIASAAGALTDSASARMYKGKTAQGYQMKVVGKERAFRLQVFEVDLKCRDGSALLLEEGGFLWTKVKPNGSFRDSQFGKTDSVYFRGRMTEKHIRGRLRVTDKEKRGPMCASRWIAFKATPR